MQIDHKGIEIKSNDSIPIELILIKHLTIIVLGKGSFKKTKQM